MLGIFNLTNKLTKILFTHIKHSLPEIMHEIKDKARETEDDLKDLGPPMHRNRLRKCSYSGVWLLISLVRTKMRYQENLMRRDTEFRVVQEVKWSSPVVQKLRWTSSTCTQSSIIIEPLKITMICTFKKLFRCTKVMVCLDSHQSTFSFIWSTLSSKS